MELLVLCIIMTVNILVPMFIPYDILLLLICNDIILYFWLQLL